MKSAGNVGQHFIKEIQHFLFFQSGHSFSHFNKSIWTTFHRYCISIYLKAVSRHWKDVSECRIFPTSSISLKTSFSWWSSEESCLRVARILLPVNSWRPPTSLSNHCWRFSWSTDFKLKILVLRSYISYRKIRMII